MHHATVADEMAILISTNPYQASAKSSDLAVGPGGSSARASSSHLFGSCL